VLPRESRHMRQERRNRRRTDLAALERLESRDLMAFSSLGFSLPQLVVSGQAGPRAAWGGTLNVSVYLQNIGASTTTEPTAQAPGATSQADAGNSTVAVLLTPHAKSLKGAINLGTIDAPPIPQNNFEQLTQAFTLPSRPAGFKGSGGKFFVRFVANSNDALQEASQVNNISKPVPVSVVGSALPELRAIALYVPDVMQPGDTISPTIQIENLGTAATDLQGPLQVALVASVTPDFTLGSSIVALYTIANIPSISQTPVVGNYKTFAQNSVVPPSNVVTITGAPVTLPTSPGTYYLGVVIDPSGKIDQLSLPSNLFTLSHKVGPANSGLPPAGVVNSGNTELFPNAPNSEIIGNV
jgi:hypothetical protein